MSTQHGNTKIWREISNVVCMNVMQIAMKQFMISRKLNDLSYPLAASLYIGLNWKAVCFSQEIDIDELRPLVDKQVFVVVNSLMDSGLGILLKELQIPTEHDQAGGLVFSHNLNGVIQKGYHKYLEQINPMDFFQRAWEIQFWFIQALMNSGGNEKYLQTINEFGEHEKYFKQIVQRINAING